MTDLDLEAIKRTWLNQCGPCDYGMPEYGCTHPQEDYRPVIMSLVLEVERLRTIAGSCPSCGHQWWAHKPAGGDDVAQVCIGGGSTCTCTCRSDRLGLFAAASELLHVCYGCQEPDRCRGPEGRDDAGRGRVLARQVHQRIGGDMIDQSDWPAWLRDDAPYQQCDYCDRKTWDTDAFNQTCGMTLPGRGPCAGKFRPTITHGD